MATKKDTYKIAVTTDTGFKCDVNRDALNDVELLDDIIDMNNGELISVHRIVDKVIGKEQRAALYDHVRDDKGVVKLDAISAELTNIFDAVQNLKN